MVVVGLVSNEFLTELDKTRSKNRVSPSRTLLSPQLKAGNQIYLKRNTALLLSETTLLKQPYESHHVGWKKTYIEISKESADLILNGSNTL